MTGPRVEIDGDERLAATLDSAADELADTRDALEQSGRVVEQRARSGAPVDTGALARSITANVEGVEVLVGPNVGVYAGVQEYGSATTPAHPYLRPALDYSDTVVTGIFADHMNGAIGKVKGA